MKISYVHLLLLFPICSAFGLSPRTLGNTEALKLLEKTDATTSFAGTDFSAGYTLVQERPGEGRSLTEAVMYRRDSKSCYTILIRSPASDKGKGYVQFDRTLWFYDPHDNQFTFTSAKNKFQNTNANNGDFAPQHFSRDYTIESAETVQLGTFSCVQYHLKASIRDVDYPELKLWVSEDSGLLRKKEDYSLSGQLLRTTAIPSYQLVDNRYVPVKILIADNLRGRKLSGKMQYERTQITLTDVSFEKQSDMVYTKQYLELMSKQ